MIDLAISRFHGENVARLTKIEERIIGIDGNGTGKIGALQRQDAKLEQLGDNQDRIEGKIDGLIHSNTSWDKAKVWRNLRWMLGTLIALLAIMLSYMGYRAAQNPTKPVSAVHAQAQTSDAGVDTR